MRVVSTRYMPKGLLTANERSGWVDGIAYSPSEITDGRKRRTLARKKREAARKVQHQVEAALIAAAAKPLTTGKSVSKIGL